MIFNHAYESILFISASSTGQHFPCNLELFISFVTNMKFIKTSITHCTFFWRVMLVLCLIQKRLCGSVRNNCKGTIFFNELTWSLNIFGLTNEKLVPNLKSHYWSHNISKTFSVKLYIQVKGKKITLFNITERAAA